MPRNLDAVAVVRHSVRGYQQENVVGFDGSATQ